MKASVPANAIPFDTAARLCEEIRSENERRWYTFNGIWCLFCVRFSGPATKRCFANAPGARGCEQVNARYDRSVSRPEQR